MRKVRFTGCRRSAFDPEGHIKAAKELIRVLRPGGKLLIVLPMSEKPYVAFNAHRILSSDAVLDMFYGLRITAGTFQYDKEFHEKLPPGGQEYSGCFEFTKWGRDESQ